MVARLYIFQRIVLILCAYIYKQLAVRKRGLHLLARLQMYGLCAYNAFHHIIADDNAL